MDRPIRGLAPQAYTSIFGMPRQQILVERIGMGRLTRIDSRYSHIRAVIAKLQQVAISR